MVGLDDEEDLLNLSLAITTSEDSHGGRKITKRKRNERLKISDLDLDEGYGENIYSLLEMREAMLKSRNDKRKGVDDGDDEDGKKGLRLIHLLLVLATSINQNKLDLAVKGLQELYQNVCLDGDSVQRVAAYFADGLVARLLTRESPFYHVIVKAPTPQEEFLAFTALYKVSPYYQFAHFTANQAILEAFEKDGGDNNSRSLHVVDFDVWYGFQWPSLIQSLSEKATCGGKKISLQITGFGSSSQLLLETEKRLVSFAKSFSNVIFEFRGLLRGSNLSNLKIKKNEIVAANLIFHINTLSNYSNISSMLKFVHLLNPSIVILVEQEGSQNPRSFLSRFMDSLHYFAAMFDSLEDCLPLDSLERFEIEKNHLGEEIKRILNYDKDELNCMSYERIATWKARMESHGFAGLKLSSKSIMQAKLLLKIRSHCCPILQDGDNGGFRVSERDDGISISLGWQDRCLLTASTWCCV